MPGVADLPLHGGRVPAWMLRVMRELAEAIVSYMVEVRGPGSLVAMLADPLWFQAFNNVIGMDWDSSGSTTVVTGVLREVTWRRPELGVLVLGGKGKAMTRVPEEAPRAAEALGLDPGRLVEFSRLAARLDSSLLQDGYTLYHHALVVAETGEMVVVQQGMNPEEGMARRYHVTRDEVFEPHSGVAGTPGGVVLNATAGESREAVKAYLDLAGEPPRRLARLLAEANRLVEGRPSLLDYMQGEARRLGQVGARPYYRPVKPSPQLLRALEDVHRWSPTSPRELALAPSLGPRVVRALALIADLVLGVPTSTRDPVTHPLEPYAYAYAVGGKDGVPYPLDPETAVKAAAFLREAVEDARVGERVKARALEGLRRWLRRQLPGTS